jgi:hypothetical protein
MDKAATRGELQSYITEKNLTPLLTSVLESILIDKPENPIAFIVQHLIVRCLNSNGLHFQILSKILD